MNKNTDTNQKASAPETRKANDNFNADFHAIGTAAMFGSHDEDLQSDILEVARQLELSAVQFDPCVDGHLGQFHSAGRARVEVWRAEMRGNHDELIRNAGQTN